MDLPTFFAMIGSLEPEPLPPDLRVSPAHLRRARDLVARLDATDALRRSLALPDAGVALAPGIVLLRHELTLAEALAGREARAHAWCRTGRVVGCGYLVVVLSDVRDLATDVVLSRSPYGLLYRGRESDARLLDGDALDRLEEWLATLRDATHAGAGADRHGPRCGGGERPVPPPPEPLSPWPPLARMVRDWMGEEE